MTPLTPLVVYTGTFEAYQGLDLLFAAAALVVEARPDARFLLAGGRPEQVDAARVQASARGARHRCHLRGRASVRRDPRHPRSRRRARVAPQPRHEYAAEDLPVPPVRPRHRRHAPVDAYAGARRQRRHPHRRLAAGVRGRHPRGAGRPADGRHDWRARGGSSRPRNTATRRIWNGHARSWRASRTARAQVAGGVA